MRRALVCAAVTSLASGCARDNPVFGSGDDGGSTARPIADTGDDSGRGPPSTTESGAVDTTVGDSTRGEDSSAADDAEDDSETGTPNPDCIENGREFFWPLVSDAWVSNLLDCQGSCETTSFAGDSVGAILDAGAEAGVMLLSFLPEEGQPELVLGFEATLIIRLAAPPMMPDIIFDVRELQSPSDWTDVDADLNPGTSEGYPTWTHAAFATSPWLSPDRKALDSFLQLLAPLPSTAFVDTQRLDEELRAEIPLTGEDLTNAIKQSIVAGSLLRLTLTQLGPDAVEVLARESLSPAELRIRGCPEP